MYKRLPANLKISLPKKNRGRNDVTVFIPIKLQLAVLLYKKIIRFADLLKNSILHKIE